MYDFPVITSHLYALVSFASYTWLDKNFLNFSTWENKVQDFICPYGIKIEFFDKAEASIIRFGSPQLWMRNREIAICLQQVNDFYGPHMPLTLRGHQNEL